jgi:hypothetical protein
VDVFKREHSSAGDESMPFSHAVHWLMSIHDLLCRVAGEIGDLSPMD